MYSTQLDGIHQKISADDLATKEGQDRVAVHGGDYVFEKVRETAVTDQVLAPEPVSRSELRSGSTEGSSVAVPGRHTDNLGDTVFVQKEIEQGGVAMIMNFRDQPRAQYVDGKRFDIPFYVVSTPVYEKTQEELLATKYDLLKVIEDTAFMETHRARDEKFLSYCELAVGATGKALVANGPLQRSAIRDIQLPALRDEIIPVKMIMSKVACTDFNLWDHSDMGDEVASVTANGYTATKVQDITHIRSIKTKLFDTWSSNELESTKIWAFPEKRFLGYNLYYDDYRVWNAWERNLWRFWGSQMIGLGFGNIKGIVKLTVNY